MALVPIPRRKEVKIKQRPKLFGIPLPFTIESTVEEVDYEYVELPVEEWTQKAEELAKKHAKIIYETNTKFRRGEISAEERNKIIKQVDDEYKKYEIEASKHEVDIEFEDAYLKARKKYIEMLRKQH